MAGNYSWTSSNRVGTEAEFRAWAGGISDALRRVFGGGAGASYSANRVEASAIASDWNATIFGYSSASGGLGALTPEWAWEVWRLPDYATMGTPIFIRIGYCISGSSSATPGLTIRVGTSYTAPASGALTGVDGSGSLLMSVGTSQTSVTGTNWASCDDSGFALVMGVDHTNGSANRWWFVLDRHRDTDGTPLDTAVAVFRGSSAASTIGVYMYDLVEPNLTGYATTWAPCVTHGNIESTTSNLNDLGEVQVYPWWTTTKNSMGVSKMICTHAVADIVSLNTQQVRWLPSTGVSPSLRTVRSAGTFLTNAWGYDINGNTPNASTGTTVAFWWSDP